MIPSRSYTTVFVSLALGMAIGISTTGIAGAVLKGSSIFNDIPSNSYYDDAVGAMYAKGIIKGYDAQHFGPNDYVTRGQVAVMLQRLHQDIVGTTAAAVSSRSRISSASQTSSNTSSVQVTNNPKGMFRFTTNSFTTSETNSTLTISVVRIGGNQGSASVNYAVTSNTATAGSDFEAISGTLSFDNKETSKLFTITIKDDSLSEGPETALITLSTPTNGATVSIPSTATLTINDNESSARSSSSQNSVGSISANGSFSWSALTYGVNENAGSLTLTVRREGNTSGAVGVSYTYANGSGINGTDFGISNGTLSFAQGETLKTITVSVNNNSSVTGGKNFSVTLTNPTGGATLGKITTASIMINDDETEAAMTGTGSFRFTKTTIDVTESMSHAQVVVQRIGGATAAANVDFTTYTGSAFPGSDYTTTSGTLSFATGETSKIILIPLVKDALNESEENFNVQLTGASNGGLVVTPSTMTINIFD